MTQLSESESKNSRTTRSDLTTKIWGFATGMLALCIPLSTVTNSGPLLPLTVITGAAVGTGAVWQSYYKKTGDGDLLINKLEVLEDRLANLETIVDAEELSFQQRIKHLESKDHVG
ncbi:MAG: hypothetical protein F6K36_14915 [Symploca sp. SIO3C6]|uniref:Uncharacterized protein n=1 Tax=Symploca sp. SIO1C4 TaxID=2607765 RepID=A0A6B3NPB3_9CYAN|nr:hypothetical protein [Symploca sp. SIO3C6]NER31078.1 hypothetical protein [Symploca sp. SIO1C4]NET08407.1 hypothetical protein [Symploca sp. SIO2B6]NET52364.1 hypothetical protein [Merismopedia sp. SIO2A8]